MMSAATPYITICPIGCGEILEPAHLMLREGRVRRCRECGQWVSAVDEARYTASMIGFDVPKGTEPDTRSQRRRLLQNERKLKQIARRLTRSPSDIRLLDVGCSSGAFLMAAKALGFVTFGVEPAPKAAAAARSAGLDVQPGLLEEVHYPAAHFDAITLFEVVEHLREPLAMLKECHRVLAPGGMVVIGTANTASWTARALGASWDYLDIARCGGHVSFFNPWSTTLLAQRAGLRVETIRTRSVRLAQRGDAVALRYLSRKLLAEMLEWPARWLGRGHDLLAFLRKDS